MTACISVTSLSSRGQYPVLDPRRVAGTGPFKFGYTLAADGIVIGVARDPSLSHCQMRVDLVSTLAEPKDILAWNLFANVSVDRIGSAGLGLPSSMTIRRSSSMGLSCGQGTDSVVLRRRDAPFSNWTAWYWFSPPDFWDFWGGCNVTFEWFSDTARGLWADQIPTPTYPVVALPDKTLMVDNTLPAGDPRHFRLVFGGTDFAVPESFLSSWALAPADAIPARTLPSIPADFTLVRELFAPEVYVIYGGAKFWIRSPAMLTRLGFSESQINVLPIGGTAKLREMPIDGTLLREEKPATAFLVEKGKLRRISNQAAMDGRCIPGRHVRIVPNKSLTGLKKGTSLGPP